MSYVEVYKVCRNGDVTPYDFEVHNATAGAYYIWETLSKKYLGVPFHGLNQDRVNRLWRLVGSGRMTPGEDWVLAFTFDNSWVKRENLPELIQGLEEFWSAHSSTVSTDWQVHPTIPGLIGVFQRAAGDETLRGLAFNQTSVNSNPWLTKIPYAEMVKEIPGLIAEEYCEDPKVRPFNLDKDAKTRWGGSPCEVGDRVDSYRKFYAEGKTWPT